ncbi:hypothetical protein ACFQZT_00060 [Paenibacillus sp. GCM10027628]|uniref:hypothetical protein n=1 Tax=Paenibacillus sp. GCM10027628 TaxID=3273413 RepID=UPI00362939AB
MRKTSKWLKWQVGAVILAIMFYLFQEVKTSPEFLAAVKAASSKQSAVASAQQNPQTTIQGDTFSRSNGGNQTSRRHGLRQGNGGVSQGGTADRSGNSSSQSSPQVQPHARSQGS